MLHLADLHIGRRLNGLSLLEDQRAVLYQALDFARECDCVLLAGDLFDKAQPSSESLKMVSDFLVALGRMQKPVFAISGNHDNAQQLAYCHELLENSGVHIAPAWEGELTRYSLKDEWGQVDFWLLPYVKPAQVRAVFPWVSTGEDAVRAVLEAAKVDFSRRNVLVMHQFVLGGQECQSESPMVGGLDCVRAETLQGFDYVALGHLHSPQRLMGGKVCYAGSPLKYSLSEERQKKAALLVSLGAKGELETKQRPFQPLRDLRTLRGSLKELAAGNSEDYIYAVLTDRGALLDPVGTLRVSYPNLIGLMLENSAQGEDAQTPQGPEVETLSPLEHFVAFYRAQNGDQPPAPEQLDWLEKIISRAQEALHETHQA